jgi:plasmid stabilization system protein ParE
MTRYTVVWLQEALDELTWIWLAASDRAEVTAATAKLDALLVSDPSSSSQSVSDGLRKLIVKPLTAFFEVREDDRLVEIVRIRRKRALDDLT